MLSNTPLKPAPVDGQTVAIEALGFIASDPKLMARFTDVTGIDPADIRSAAAEPGFLAGVLVFVLANEPDLVSFCHATAKPLESVQLARDGLDAGR